MVRDLLWCLVILLRYLVIYYSEVVNYRCSTYVVIDVFIMVVTSWIAFVYMFSYDRETERCVSRGPVSACV